MKRMLAMFKLEISAQDRLVVEHVQQLLKIDAACDVLMKQVSLNVCILNPWGMHLESCCVLMNVSEQLSSLVFI